MGRLDLHFPNVLSLVRIVTALLFLEHGLMKVFHFPIAQPGAPSPLPPLIYIAGVLEIAGGVLIALGLFTRVAAFICSGEMAVAYFMGHASKSFFPAQNGGDPAILFCFVFLLLVFSGPGSISLDAQMRKGGAA